MDDECGLASQYGSLPGFCGRLQHAQEIAMIVIGGGALAALQA